MKNDELVLDDLDSVMRCAILTDSNAQTIIIHDQPIEGVVDFIQYDPQEKIFLLTFDDSRIQELGIPLDERIHNNLLSCQKVTLALLEGKRVVDFQEVLFIQAVA